MLPKSFALPLIGLALSLCLPVTVRAQGSPIEEAAIRRLVSEMTDGFNRHDAAGYMRLYTSDAEFVSVRGEKAKGRDHAEQELAEIFKTRAKEAALKTKDVDVRFIRPDVALVHVTNELSGLVAADGHKLPPHDETSLRVFVKNDGKWQVTAFQNTLVAPFTTTSSH